MKRFMTMCAVLLLSGLATAASATQVTLTMDELPYQPVDGLSVKGVTFGFTVGGVPSTDADYDASNGGVQHFTQDPVIEGDANGVLTVDFASPTPLVQFGLTLAARGTLTPGFSVELFDQNLTSLGVTNVNTSRLSGDGFTEGQFSHFGALVSRAVVSFNVTSERFGFDNLAYYVSSAEAPALSFFGLLALSVLLWGLGTWLLRAEMRY